MYNLLSYTSSGMLKKQPCFFNKFRKDRANSSHA